MLDRFSRHLMRKPLDLLAAGLEFFRLTPNTLTYTGLILGLSLIPVLAQHHYRLAFFIFGLNRLLDGLDGALARRIGASEFGAYLDIVCDMIFYAALVLGMAFAQPENALWSCVLLFSFMGTSASFLAFGIFAEKHQLKDPEKRGFYYLEGLTEGTETILFFCAFLLFPWLYKSLALLFSALCWITIVGRLMMVHKRLNRL